MKVQLSVIIFFLFFSLTSFAKEVKVGGTVVDENGEPVELATVRIEGTAIGTVSNLKGRYSLKFASRDRVTIIYSMIGYNLRKRTLVRSQRYISIHNLLPASCYVIVQVTVT